MGNKRNTGKNLTFSKSVAIAAHGFVTVFKNEAKVRLSFLVAFIFVSLAIWIKVSYIELFLILFAWAQVVVGEIFNTSLEKAMDYASDKEFHPLSELGKDYAAGSVFVLSVFASCSSLFIIGIKYFKLV